jgi:hypothetical protein
VSQISPPIRIVLVCAVAFMAAYMLFLRPKDETVAEPPVPAPNVQTAEPAVSEPGKVAEAAQDAVNAADAQLEAQESIDGVDAGESAAGTATGTGKAAEAGDGAAATVPADLKGVPKPVAKAIGKQQVLVLLFWNDRSADDRAVRSALRKVDRWDGRVFVHAASIKTISKYGRVSRGVNVEQSPTVVVVDPELRAETVVGYVDTTTIDQMVVDAFRNSTGLFEDRYLAEINQVCLRVIGAFAALEAPDSPREYAVAVSARKAKLARFQTDFKAVKTPKKWRRFDRATMRDNAAVATVFADWTAFVGRNPSLATVAAAQSRFPARVREINRGFNRRMDAEHVFGCGSTG